MNVVPAYLAAPRSNGFDIKLHGPLERMAQLEWDWSSHTDAAVTAQSLAERMTLNNLFFGDSVMSRPRFVSSFEACRLSSLKCVLACLLHTRVFCRVHRTRVVSTVT